MDIQIQLTKSAADKVAKEIEEIKKNKELKVTFGMSPEEAGIGETVLHVIVEQEPKQNNCFCYQLGLDNRINLDYLSFKSRKVPMIASKDTLKLAPEMKIDFAKGKEGAPRFIFLNPNDPADPSEQKGLEKWGTLLSVKI